MSARRVLSLLALIAVALACGRNAPRGACDPAPAAGELGSVCGFENPEDVAWVPTRRLLLVSQMRHSAAGAGGSLAALSLAADGAPSAPARRLWPPAHAATASPQRTGAPVGDPACTHAPAAGELRAAWPRGGAAGSGRRADGRRRGTRAARGDRAVPLARRGRDRGPRLAGLRPAAAERRRQRRLDRRGRAPLGDATTSPR